MNFLRQPIPMSLKNLSRKIAANLLLVVILFATTAFNLDIQQDVLSYQGHDRFEASTLLAAANKSKTTYPTDDQNLDGVLYGDREVDSLDSVDDFVAPATQKKLLDPSQIPAVKQPIIDRSNPDNKLLEKATQMFDDSGVLQDK